MTRVRPVLIVFLSLALLAVPLGPSLAEPPPDWPSSFWGQVTIAGYSPTASTALHVYRDVNSDHFPDTGEPLVASTTLRDEGGVTGWVYTVHVPAGTCTEGDSLAFELSQPPIASNASLAIAEDSDPSGVTVTVAEGLGAVDFGQGVDPVWASGTNTRRDLAALTTYGVTVEITSAPSSGQATVAGTTITYTPDANYCGADALTYTAMDSAGQSDTADVAITVTCVNDPPIELSLSNAEVDEGLAVGSVVGTLSVTDPDEGDSHTYSLVPIAESNDHEAFRIVGQELQTDAVLDRNTQSGYTIQVRATDGALAFVEDTFAITVRDVNTPPTGLALTGSSVAENVAIGTEVGTLSTTDPDVGDTYTYSLVPGEGDTGNAAFAISGATLQTAAALNYEAQSTYSVRIRTDDGHAGGTYEQAFTITVVDVNEPPVVTAPPGETITQSGAFTAIDLSDYGTDPDAGGSLSWSASGHSNLQVNIAGSMATITVGTSGWDGMETVTFTAEDGGGLTASAAAEFRVLARQQIPLPMGWVLLGYGLLTEEMRVDALLGAIDGSFDLAYAWDAATQGWQLYSTEESYPNVDVPWARGQGLWVHVTSADASLAIDGRAEGTTEVSVLESAWHLVSFPSGVAEPLPGALVDHGLAGAYTLVYGYDANDAADPWEVYDPIAADWANDLSIMEPGRGYWLRTGVGQSGTWSVTYERPTP